MVLEGIPQHISDADNSPWHSHALTGFHPKMHPSALALLATSNKLKFVPFELPELPYPPGSLAPITSQETISFHYGKHHAGYVANLNRLTKDTPWENLSLEEVITNSDDDTIFNNAAQIWNHTFFWNSMHPEGGGQPADTSLTQAISQSFGSYDALAEEFKTEALCLFGSGWVWLVANPDGSLRITTTFNAELPLRCEPSSTALLTLDVWEHAYYLDHKNNRAAFIDGWLERLINWEFAAKNFATKNYSA